MQTVIDELSVEVCKALGYRFNDSHDLLIAPLDAPRAKGGVICRVPKGKSLEEAIQYGLNSNDIPRYSHDLTAAFELLERTARFISEKVQIETATRFDGDNKWRAAYIPESAWAYPGGDDSELIDWTKCIYMIEDTPAQACCKVWLEWKRTQAEID